MTRFARSQGSKGCNRREEEQATPWHEMLAQMRPNPSHTVRHPVINPEEDENGNYDLEASDAEEQLVEQSSEEPAPVPDDTLDDPAQKVDLVEAPSESELPKKKTRSRAQNKCLNCKQPGHLKRFCPDLDESRRQELQQLFSLKVERKGHGTGRKKTKLKIADSLSAASEPHSSLAKKIKVCNRDGRRAQEQPVKDKTGNVVMPGEGLFQGFRVKQEDATRLKQLQAKLVREKVTAEEVKQVMKRERRRAEKELARSKKNVCFNCRQPGHLLAECTATNTNNGGEAAAAAAAGHEILSGVCFKCGSAEHSSKECKSKKKDADAYQFATCFICHQMGHLAKACPDNPKGLYPKGGGCRFCGSVEHLKSDCPRKLAKDAKNEVRVATAKHGMSIEHEDEDLLVRTVATKKKAGQEAAKQSKVVSF